MLLYRGMNTKNHSINIRIDEKTRETFIRKAQLHKYSSVAAYIRPKLELIAEMEDYPNLELIDRLSSLTGLSDAEVIFRALMVACKAKGINVTDYE